MNASQSETLGYDALGRLTGVTSGAGNASYAYDADGNRIAQTGAGANTGFTYATGSNQLVSTTGGVGLAAAYGYNADGNTVTLDGKTAYQYGPFDRLTNAGGVAYTVGATGERLAKVGNGGATYFARGAGGQLQAEDVNGTWRDYVWLNGRLVTMVANGGVYTVASDQTGRSVALTAPNSHAVLWSAATTSFDRTVASNAWGSFDLGYPGQYADAESGLWHNGQRDYDPATGRYIESDPIGLGGGVNTYAYVGDDPANSVDPMGLCKCNGQRKAPSPQQYQDLGKAMKLMTMFGGPLAGAANLAVLYQFHRGGLLDAQVRYGGTTAYANYAFGVEMSANGVPLDMALSAADGYAQYSGATQTYKNAGDAMDKPNYPDIPASNAENIVQGYDDQRSGTLCTIASH